MNGSFLIIQGGVLFSHLLDDALDDCLKVGHCWTWLDFHMRCLQGVMAHT